MIMNKETIAVAAARNRGAQYDASVKTLLRYPKLVAPILQALIPEYRNYTAEQVAELLVPSGSHPVDDTSVMVSLNDTEVSSISEKLIRYDARFKLLNPDMSDREHEVYLHVDLEVQNNYRPANPKYPMITRGIYYAARLLGSELGILTEKTDYANLEKVYSIWICNDNIPVHLRNTVVSVQLEKKDLIGFADIPEKDYDLMTVILVHRGSPANDEKIFRYLEALFKGDVDGICEHIDVHDDQEIMEEVEAMDELWKGVAHEHYRKGADEQRKKDEAKLAEKDAVIAEQAATIAEQAATLEEMEREIERLKKR
jgi:hypothetical protein